jgi:hypothetical protein
VAIDYSGGAAASVSTAGVTSNYQTTDVTGLTLPATINPGDTWSQTFFIEGETDLGGGTVGTAVGEATSTFQAVGFEEVSVPAGSFEALRVDVQISLDLSVTMADLSVPVLFTSTGSTWYAAGVGWVKSEASAVVADTPFNELLELTSYSIP